MKNFPLLIKLFFALALFIIIPVVIVSVITNFTLLHYAENEISKSSIGKLKVGKSLTEILAANVSKETLSLSLSNSLNQLSNVTNYQAALKNINQLSLLSQNLGLISQMIKTNNIYQSVYLYLDDTDYILSASFLEPETVIQKQDYQDTGWLKHYQDYKRLKTSLTWLKTRMPKYNSTYIPGDLNHSGNEALYYYVISYIYPLTPYTSKLQGAIVVNLYEDSLCKLINSNNSATEGTIFIMNQQGDVFTHVDKELVSKNIADRNYIKEIIKSQSPEGYLVTKINNKRSLITYLKTDFNDWIYVGVFPLDNLMGMATSLRIRSIYISMFIVLIGIILSFVISHRIFNPVKQLVQDIKHRIGINLIDNGNEMTLISNAFDTIIKEENMLADTLEHNKRSIRDNYLMGLLRGDFKKDINLEVIGDSFSLPYYVCALIVIDKYEEFRLKYPEDQGYNMKELILKTTEEVVANSFCCAGFLLERERMALLINTTENEAQVLSRIKECFDKVKEEIAKIFDYPISIGISRCHEGKSGIKTSYNEAQETLKLKLLEGYGRVYLWQEADAESKKYFYPVITEKHILNHLNLGQKEGALRAIEDLCDEIKGKPDLSFDNIIQIFNQILGNIIKYLVESHIKISDIFENNYNIYQDLSTKETLDEIKFWLSQIFTRIFEFREQSNINNKTHVDNILDYIHKHYRQDIDINTLADYIGLSYSHVRKIFHDATGENIVNYINNLRIEEAKRLLSQTKLTINEIALNLGYNNKQSFNRFFKKYEGITPGEFRKT